MSNILDSLQAKRRLEVVLQTGLEVGYHLPDLEECVLFIGDIPLTDLPGGDAKLDKADEAETVRRGFEYKQRVVAAMLDDIDGEPLDPSDDRMAIAKALQPAERAELFLLGTRRKDPDSGEA